MADRLDFRKLRYVVAVAQVQSLTAAAKMLSITQPALTRCIGEVEDDLGIQIFMRLPRGVALTEDGEQFVNRARVLLADLEALGEDFQYGSGTARRKLRLGGSPATYLALVAQSLAHMAAANGDIDISTTTGLPREVFPRLETGELDAVLTTTFHLEHWSDLPVETVASLHFAFMVRQGHPLENRKRVSRADVLQFPAVLGATSDSLYLDMAEIHGKEGLPQSNAPYVTDDFTLIFALLNNTDAYLPIVSTKAALKELSQNFSMVGWKQTPTRHDLCVAYPRTRAVSPLAREFTEIARSMLGD